MNTAKVPTGFLNTITSRFLRLTIAKKMLLGYVSLLLLLIIISVFALVNLNRLNSINRSVLQTDIPVIAAADKMVDIILAQELYARRYAILQTADMQRLDAKSKALKDRADQLQTKAAQLELVNQQLTQKNTVLDNNNRELASYNKSLLGKNKEFEQTIERLKTLELQV